MAAHVESRVAEILAAAERAVAEAQEHASDTGRLDRATGTRGPERTSRPSVPVPEEVLEWRALSDPDATEVLWEPPTNGELDGGFPSLGRRRFFSRMAAELRDEESRASSRP